MNQKLASQVRRRREGRHLSPGWGMRSSPLPPAPSPQRCREWWSWHRWGWEGAEKVWSVEEVFCGKDFLRSLHHSGA